METAKSMEEQFAALSDNYDVLISFMVGQRAKLEEAGFSPTASESMVRETWIMMHRQMTA